MEAEWIDLPAASLDGVLCRWGYMLLVDPEAALRETPGASCARAAGSRSPPGTRRSAIPG